jgi:hypothetical protein
MIIVFEIAAVANSIRFDLQIIIHAAVLNTHS